MSVLAAVLAVVCGLSVQEEVEPRPSGGKGGQKGVFADETIAVDGRKREFRLVVPDSVDLSKPAPLLFAFHGLTDSKDRMPLYTRLNTLAEKKGFILVYPNGENRKWRIVPRRNPDLDFFEALYEHLISKYDVDLNRVYVTGMSNGAYFTNLLGSKFSDRIAAVAPHSGGLGLLAVRGIKAKRKYPVMVIHGDKDPIVPLLEAKRSRDRYEKEGHEVEYVEVEGLGHMWAGRIGINEKMWEFFLEHTMKK